MLALRSACVALAVASIGPLAAQAGSLQLYLAHSTPAGVPAGYGVTDISIDFTDTANPPGLRGQQLIVTLTHGSIFQHPFGSNTAPNAALIAAFSDLAFDTFVTMGGLTASTSQPVLIPMPLDPLPEGPLGGSLKFDTTGINIAWAPGAGKHRPTNRVPHRSHHPLQRRRWNAVLLRLDSRRHGSDLFESADWDSRAGQCDAAWLGLDRFAQLQPPASELTGMICLPAGASVPNLRALA